MKSLSLSFLPAALIILLPGKGNPFTLQGGGGQERVPVLKYTFSGKGQREIYEGPEMAAFERSFRGPWFGLFNEADGTPLWIMGRGVDALKRGGVDEREIFDFCSHFISRTTRLHRVRPEYLVPLKGGCRGGICYASYGREYRGIPVWGGGAEFRFKYGRLLLFGYRTFPNIDISPLPQLSPKEAEREALEFVLSLSGAEGEVNTPPLLYILPELERGRFHYSLVYLVNIGVKEPVGNWSVMVDAGGGGVRYFWDNIRWSLSGTIYGEHDMRTVGDPIITSPMPDINVIFDTTTVYTDDEGYFSVDIDEESLSTLTLAGKYTTILNMDGENALEELALLPDAPATFTWTDDYATRAEIDAYVNVMTVHDWASHYLEGDEWLEMGVSAIVNRTETVCNAYWDGRALHFYREGGGCNNAARVADVVYHEFGHGIHQNILLSGRFDLNISEGSSDYISATINNDPIIGKNFFTNGNYIRDIEADLVYPQDVGADSHLNGLIWAGALWDLREALIDRYGYEDGVATVDRLFLTALTGGPTLITGFAEILLADDDDGDLSNGTPNICEIIDAFSLHGLASDEMAGIQFSHTPLTRVYNEEGYEVVAEIFSPYSQCLGLEEGSPSLHFGEEGEEFSILSMEPTGNPEEFMAVIPPYPSGTIVRYFFSAADTEGVTYYSPPDAPDRYFNFMVGQFDTIYCDDFEGGEGEWSHGLDSGEPGPGADDWMLGTPIGLSNDPSSAYSGENLWGNDLGGEIGEYTFNGTYQADITNHLLSPEIAIAGYRNIYLQYLRWLSVEDALYDQATIYVNDEEVWQNEETRQGNNHHIDTFWNFHIIPLSDFEGLESIEVKFEISSDAGLEFGGWNIDDFCIVSLSNRSLVEKVSDFSASDFEDSRSVLRWTNPSGQMLKEVWVMRKEEDYPMGIEDGDVIYSNDSPLPGEETTYVDGPLENWKRYYYAVYTVDINGDAEEGAEEGKNADWALPMPGEVDATGCSCMTLPHPCTFDPLPSLFPLLFLPLLLLLSRNRD